MGKKEVLDGVLKRYDILLDEYSDGKDLVKAGLYTSVPVHNNARRRGNVPISSKDKRGKVIYHKDDVLDYIREKLA